MLARWIGINHQALVSVLHNDAADQFANAVGINALQGTSRASPAGCERDQADEQGKLDEQARHHRTAGY